MANKEIIKTFYESFKKNDKQTYLQLCDENLEWISMDGMPSGGKYIGRNSVFDHYFPAMLSNFKEFHAEPTELLTVEDTIIVFGRYHGISKSNKKFDVPFSHVYVLKDDKIIRFQQFTDTKKIQDSLI
ncbi:MAG: nuclear transport factor 2 family protein [Thaumarchaeota archaeon]|nr:nuclear transport factor 2 family protein [Nitrososphaerota archaeon]